MARIKIWYRYDGRRSCCEKNFLGWLNRLVDRIQEYFHVNLYTAQIDPESNFALLDVKGDQDQVKNSLAMIDGFDAHWVVVSDTPQKSGVLVYECADCQKRRLERGY
ncbi:MAG: hypothetical protein HY226_04315 [Candidatus Vogelbacteria bacterium]|nr:hypothetical protein [Candidatus Vogelbacteria bacterium]